MDKNLEQHFNQEIEMACSQLYNAAMDAAKLHDMVKDVDHLEAWQQSKITKAGDYLTSVLKSLGHDIAMDKLNIDHDSMTDNALDNEESIVNTDSLEYYVNEGICPHCNGEMVSEEVFMEAKKDACYHKVKSRYKIWPSAYASGALVKCRKVGAKNWGKKTNESMEEVDESLRDWFSKGGKGGAGGGGWDRYNTKGERIGKCGERKAGEGKPKCLSKEKAASLRASGGKKAIAAAVRKKRREDPNPERKGKADMVSNKTKNESMAADVFGVKEFDKLNSMLEKYKSLYTNAMGETPLDLLKINTYHEKMLELVQLLQKMKAKSMPVKETDTESCDTYEDTYESRFEHKLKNFLEGSMGGINVSHPAVDVSYEKVLDTDYETDQEKHAEKKKMHRKGKEFAKKIEMDMEEISYDEKLNEYLNSPEIFNEDYAEENSKSIILEDLSLEVIGNKNSKYISEDEITIHCDEICGILEEDEISEAEYRGRKVQLNKPMRGDVKKFKVFVKDPKSGNVKKVNFGDPNMRIKKSNPQRRKSFRARHNCDNPGPKTKARYWSCRKW